MQVHILATISLLLAAADNTKRADALAFWAAFMLSVVRSFQLPTVCEPMLTRHSV